MYSCGDKTKEGQIDEACGMDGRNEKRIQCFGGEIWRK
jgi:hypothetical protein